MGMGVHGNVMGIRVTDSWQRFVRLPVFIPGGC